MKRITTWIKALSVLALLIVGLQTGPVQAWQTSYSGLTWISADSSYFRRINLDTVTAWHNYDIYFPKTPAASQADGSRMFNFTTTVSTDPSNSGAEWTGLYSAVNKTSQTTGVMTLNGIEGVARAQGKSIGATLRGVYGRTYASADTHRVTSMFGGDFSSRSASGWLPKFGTAFVGARIYMAGYPLTAAMGQDSINNYHGLWIYDENTTGLATTNAIKIGTGGARFKYDLALQNGQTITDTTRGTIFNKPILSPQTFSDTLRMRSDTTVALIFLRGRADSAWAIKARKGTTTWNILLWGDTIGNVNITGGLNTSSSISSGSNIITADRFYFSGYPAEAYHPHTTFGSFFTNARATANYKGSFFWGHTLNDTTTAKGAIMYLDSTHLRVKLGDIDATGKSVLADTVKAKVVATTAMSEYNITGLDLNAWARNASWVQYYGATCNSYSVTAGAEAIISFPHTKINGGKVIADSMVVSGIINKTTDTLKLRHYKLDSLGVFSVSAFTDTVIGTGSRATFRKAVRLLPADTSWYDTGYVHGLDFVFATGRTDTAFMNLIKFKYHTIP